MKTEEAQKKKKKRKKGSIILFVIEILILLVLVGGIYLYAKLNEGLRNLGTEIGQNENGENAFPSGDPREGVYIDAQVVGNQSLSGYYNIALVGLDTREGTMDYGNSDTVIIASINYDTGDVRLASLYRDTYLCIDPAAERYDKCNAAYNLGGDTQLLSMLNANFDLNITDYLVVDFKAVARTVDDIGGIEVWMTQEEVIHLNNYCVETSEVTGLPYTPLEPQVEAQDYHLNGVQAVSYARIRYTAGNDMKRTQRQRLVIQKIIDKGRRNGLRAATSIIQDVLPLCKTNLSNAQIIQMASQMYGYRIAETTGFPYAHLEDDLYDEFHSNPLDCVVPVTLEDNVKELHAFLFKDYDYQVSDRVKEISDHIVGVSGFGEESREAALENSVIANNGGEADLV